MKQALLLWAAAGLLLFTSCSSDEEMTVNKDQLLGEWALQSIHYTTFSVLGEGDETMTSHSVVTAKDIDSGAAFHTDPYEFNTWGSYTAVMEVWSQDMDPEKEGMKSEMMMPPFMNEGKWELRDGNVLRIFGPDGIEHEDYRIEVTDQLLVMHIDLDRETSFMGYPQKDKVEGSMTYTK